MNTLGRFLASGIFTALAYVMFSGTAHALDRIEYQAAVKIYLGGTTATDGLLEAVFIAGGGQSVCDPVLGDIDIWRSVNQRVITCRVSDEHPVTAGRGFASRAAGGTPIAVHKESVGGSSNGVYPLIAVAKAQAQPLRWLNVGDLASDCVAAPVGAGTLLAYMNHSSCTLVQTPSDTAGSSTFDVHGGISEVEPGIHFPSPGIDASLLVAGAALDQIYGVAVTTALYRALQIAKFGAGSPCAGADTPTCVPTLEQNQIAALYSQSVTDWNDFTPPGAATSLPFVAGVVAPADELVRICRRTARSSAQASFESVLLDERCVAGVAASFALPDDASTIADTIYVPSDFGSGSLVNAGPGAANVRTCLTAASNGNYWGIGVLSTEGPIADPGLRFIGINGALPNRTEVANGRYSFFTQFTVNHVAGGRPGALPGGDSRLDIVELVRERLGPIFVLLHVDPPAAPFGIGGMLAPCHTATSSTSPYTDAEMAASPVNTQTRNASSCTPALMCRPQPGGRP